MEIDGKFLMKTRYNNYLNMVCSIVQFINYPIPAYLPNTAMDPFRKPDIKKNAVFQDEIEM